VYRLEFFATCFYVDARCTVETPAVHSQNRRHYKRLTAKETRGAAEGSAQTVATVAVKRQWRASAVSNVSAGIALWTVPVVVRKEKE
jgi:hypothetical protein